MKNYIHQILLLNCLEFTLSSVLQFEETPDLYVILFSILFCFDTFSVRSVSRKMDDSMPHRQ